MLRQYARRANDPLSPSAKRCNARQSRPEQHRQHDDQARSASSRALVTTACTAHPATPMAKPHVPPPAGLSPCHCDTRKPRHLRARMPAMHDYSGAYGAWTGNMRPLRPPPRRQRHRCVREVAPRAPRSALAARLVVARELGLRVGGHGRMRAELHAVLALAGGLRAQRAAVPEHLTQRNLHACNAGAGYAAARA